MDLREKAQCLRLRADLEIHGYRARLRRPRVLKDFPVLDAHTTPSRFADRLSGESSRPSALDGLAKIPKISELPEPVWDMNGGTQHD